MQLVAPVFTAANVCGVRRIHQRGIKICLGRRAGWSREGDRNCDPVPVHYGF